MSWSWVVSSVVILPAMETETGPSSIILESRAKLIVEKKVKKDVSLLSCILTAF